MFDFRLRVFHSAARHASFSKAAEELFITQPAVSKHIQSLEHYFKSKLFLRQGNKVSLTPEGQTLYKYAGEIFTLYKKMQYDMDRLGNRNTGHIRLGASTTLTQYVLPGLLNKFHHQYPEISLEILNENTDRVEEALLHKEIDLGIIEGRTKKREIKYTPFLKDELVLVARNGHPLAKKGSITLEELKEIPLVIRELGSGTLQVIRHYLKEINVRISDLNVQLVLGSTEGIKNYLKNTENFAFLSINSITEELKNGTFTIIDYPGAKMSRNFYFTSLHGEEEKTALLFENFVIENLKG